MRKIIAFLLALCLLIPAAVSADTSKELRKALNKEKKEKLKEYKKGGWKLFGSSHTLEVALLTHYDKLNAMGDNAREFTGFASNFKSKNVGKQMAANSAAINYAQTAGSTLKGRVINELSGNGSNAETEYDNFFSAYERLVETEIKNELVESYSIIRENGDGTYELQSFYIVNEDAASKARIRALEAAAAEAEITRAHADKIAGFVREGFE